MLRKSSGHCLLLVPGGHLSRTWGGVNLLIQTEEGICKKDVETHRDDRDEHGGHDQSLKSSMKT